MRTKHSGLRLWLLAFAGFFLLHAAWAFAAPYDGPADEEAHAMRAAAVGHGELFPTHGRYQAVPNSLYRYPQCFEQNVKAPADCQKAPGGDTTMRERDVSAAHYNPVYYAVLGWPVAVWPNWTGILLARLLTGAAMAALLASAVVAACRWMRHRGVLAGLVVAISPMTTSLGGAINPNGVEIAAGVALFAGLIPLLLESRERIHRPALALVGISASVLVTPRGLGVMWLGVIGLAVLVGSSRPQVRALLRERPVRVWLGVVGLSVVAATAWNVVARPLGTPAPADLGMNFGDVMRLAFLDQWPNVANQMVGVTGWSELLQPRLIYVVWFMAVGILLLGGFLLGRRNEKWQLLLLAAATFVPMLTWEVIWANQGGWFSQGRYFLPAAVGLPMLGAHILGRRGLTAVHLRSLTRTLAVLLLPIQLVVLAYTMCRWQSGLRILNPLQGSWMPPLGPVLPLVAGLGGVLVLFVLYWWASRLPRGPLPGDASQPMSARGPVRATGEDRRDPVLASAS